MKKLIYMSILAFLSRGVFSNEIPYFITTPIEYLEEFDYYSYQIISADPDSEDSLYYFVVEKPDWLTFNDFGNDTAQLVGSPDTYYDSNPVIISVTDGKDTVSQAYNIHILCLNCGPEIITEPVTEIAANEMYNSYIEATDCFGNTILTADSLPNWLSSDNSELNIIYLTGTPSNDDIGSHYVSLFAERELSICPTLASLIYSIEVLPNIDNLLDQKINSNITIFPNPFSNQISVRNANSYQYDKIIEIFNVNGEVLYCKKFSNSNLIKIEDIDFLPPDIYILKIIDNIKPKVIKIIKVDTH